MMSMGHKYTLVIASYTKWILQGEMPADMRLEFLSHLEKMTDNVLTPAVIALVEPMDAKGREIYDEAWKLGADIRWLPNEGRRQTNVFDVLYQKFDVFASLNPSLRAAYDEAIRPWHRVKPDELQESAEAPSPQPPPSWQPLANQPSWVDECLRPQRGSNRN